MDYLHRKKKEKEKFRHYVSGLNSCPKPLQGVFIFINHIYSIEMGKLSELCYFNGLISCRQRDWFGSRSRRSSTPVHRHLVYAECSKDLLPLVL